MSLQTASNSLGSSNLPNRTMDSLENNLHDQTQRLDESTHRLTGSHIPGEFPTGKTQKDEEGKEEQVTLPSLSSIWTSLSEWVKSSVPSTVDIFESIVKRIVLQLLPPPRQIAVYEATMSHPIAATFIACQLICCGVPILLFLVGTVLFAAVALLVWAILSLLILGPILLVASAMGLSLWGWGWVVYGLVMWTDRLLLNGMLGRFWGSQTQQYREELHDQSSKHMKGEEQKKKKKKK